MEWSWQKYQVKKESINNKEIRLMILSSDCHFHCHFQKAASDTYGILAVRQLAGSPGGGVGRRHHSVGHLEGLALQLASPILSDDESSVHQGKIYACVRVFLPNDFCRNRRFRILIDFCQLNKCYEFL